MTLRLHLAPDLEAAVLNAARRGGLEPTAYVQKVLQERLQSSKTGWKTLDHEEAKLLLDIAQGLPPATWARYRELESKREAEVLSSAQLEELASLSDSIEEWNARRWSCVDALAQLRGTTVEEAAKSLGLAKIVG